MNVPSDTPQRSLPTSSEILRAWQMAKCPYCEGAYKDRSVQVLTPCCGVSLCWNCLRLIFSTLLVSNPHSPTLQCPICKGEMCLGMPNAQPVPSSQPGPSSQNHTRKEASNAPPDAHLDTEVMSTLPERTEQRPTRYGPPSASGQYRLSSHSRDASLNVGLGIEVTGKPVGGPDSDLARSYPLGTTGQNQVLNDTHNATPDVQVDKDVMDMVLGAGAANGSAAAIARGIHENQPLVDLPKRQTSMTSPATRGRDSSGLPLAHRRTSKHNQGSHERQKSLPPTS